MTKHPIPNKLQTTNTKSTVLRSFSFPNLGIVWDVLLVT